MPDFSFHHAAISVPDMTKAIAWYEDMLGFVVERRFNIAAAQTAVAMLRKGDLRIELFAPQSGRPLPAGRGEPRQDILTHGNKHVAFRVDDLDTFLLDMRGRNADVAAILNDQTGRGCFIRDCAGNLIEFVEEAGPVLASSAVPASS